MPAFRRSDLPELHIFLTIARRRSFAQAAKELGGKQYLAALSGSASAFFGGGEGTTKLTVLTLP